VDNCVFIIILNNFLDASGHELGLGGQYLEKIDFIDYSGLKIDLTKVVILVACDVTNPLCGVIGAYYVFGPQKGATLEIIERLDKGLKNYAEKVKKYLKKDIKDFPGAGAAGGLGGGLLAFSHAELKFGINLMSEILELDKHIKDADLVFTGEGHTDYQTLYGKVPVGVSKIAKKYNVPVICLSGGIRKGISGLYEEGITSLFSISNRPMSLNEAISNAEGLIVEKTMNLMRLIIQFKGDRLLGKNDKL
jgi:glycerate kinase